MLIECRVEMLTESGWPEVTGSLDQLRFALREKRQDAQPKRESLLKCGFKLDNGDVAYARSVIRSPRQCSYFEVRLPVKCNFGQGAAGPPAPSPMRPLKLRCCQEFRPAECPARPVESAQEGAAIMLQSS
jgi:hypothetical protein